MPGEMSPELSSLSLKDKVVAARQESVSKVIESDAAKRAERATERENKKAERVARREVREAKFKETVGKVKDGIGEARSWDRRMMLTLGAEVKVAPKVAEIAAKHGSEAMGRFFTLRANEIAETGMAMGRWVEDRGNEARINLETTCDSIVESVNAGVEATVNKYNSVKEEIHNSFVETKENMSTGIREGKENLVKSWRRIEAVPHDILAARGERRAARIGEKIDRNIARYAEISKTAQERRSKADELKGNTRKELIVALA